MLLQCKVWVFRLIAYIWGGLFVCSVLFGGFVVTFFPSLIMKIQQSNYSLPYCVIFTTPRGWASPESALISISLSLLSRDVQDGIWFRRKLHLSKNVTEQCFQWDLSFHFPWIPTQRRAHTEWLLMLCICAWLCLPLSLIINRLHT